MWNYREEQWCSATESILSEESQAVKPIILHQLKRDGDDEKYK